jgi:hypothetical protein
VTETNQTLPDKTQAGDGKAAATTNFAASMTVNIAGEVFTLKGKLDTHNIVVEYHEPFDKAISLGTIETIADEIGAALHFDELGSVIRTAHEDIGKLPVVGEIGDILFHATIRITDIVINTSTKTYGVGLALDFTSANPLPTLFGITLMSLGFSVTKVNPKQPVKDPAAPGTATTPANQ